MSELFRHYLAGLIATAQEFSLLWAPTVNSYKRFQPGSWAPTGVGWGVDNRTLGFRKVGHGKGTPGRVPHPRAATPTATSPSPARSPAGCTGSATSCRSASRSSATATRRPTSSASRGTCPTRSRCGRASSIATECFGDDVHHHILTMAKAEWLAFNQSRHRLGAAPLLGAHLTAARQRDGD